MKEIPKGRLQTATGRGQALVEFALIAPVLVLLLVAAIDIGRGVFAYNSVTNAAREGVRLAIVNQEPTRIIQRAVAQSALAAAPNVTVEFRRSDPNDDPTANPICVTMTTDCIAIVRFETTYRPITPIIQGILFPSGVTLVARAFEPVEFICPSSTLTAAQCPRQP